MTMKNCRHRRRRLPAPSLFAVVVIIAISILTKGGGSTFFFVASSSSSSSSSQQLFVEPPSCESIIPYGYDSGDILLSSSQSSSLNSSISSSTMIVIITYPSASWIQLDLSQIKLAPNVKLQLVGTTTQEFDATSLHNNDNHQGYYSAVFEGDTILMNLLVIDDDDDDTATSTTTTTTTTMKEKEKNIFSSSTVVGRLFSSWLNTNTNSNTKNITPTTTTKLVEQEQQSSSRIIVSNIHVGLCGIDADYDDEDPNLYNNIDNDDDDDDDADDDAGSTTTTSSTTTAEEEDEEIIFENTTTTTTSSTTTTTSAAAEEDGEIGLATICGNDDRVQSYDVRLGRMGGCTAWLISEDVFIRAGHCGMPNANTRVHFTFYNTDAPLKDQYAVDLLSYRFMNGGGQDWAAGRLLPNSETGELAGVAQSAKCGSSRCGWYSIGTVPTSVSSNRITITGYGTVDPTDVRNQETHTGNLLTITSTRLKYDADTGPGNSGAPVIHANTGKAVGIHIVGGCSPSGGRSNTGQRIDAPALVDHYTRLTKTCSRNSDCDDTIFCNGDETCSNGRCKFGPARYTNGCPTPRPTARPTSKKPATRQPTTAKPSTRTPTSKPTSKPSQNPTSKPTSKPSQTPTSKPTSAKPTSIPTSLKPTSKPSSKAPSASPSSKKVDGTISPKPTTSTPTTANPTTRIPTFKPSTSQPTSFKPTTAKPTTRSPTLRPTTVKPTTAKPSFKPTTAAKPTTTKPTSQSTPTN